MQSLQDGGDSPAGASAGSDGRTRCVVANHAGLVGTESALAGGPCTDRRAVYFVPCFARAVADRREGVSTFGASRQYWINQTGSCGGRGAAGGSPKIRQGRCKSDAPSGVIGNFGSIDGADRSDRGSLVGRHARPK